MLDVSKIIYKQIPNFYIEVYLKMELQNCGKASFFCESLLYVLFISNNIALSVVNTNTVYPTSKATIKTQQSCTLL